MIRFSLKGNSIVIVLGIVLLSCYEFPDLQKSKVRKPTKANLERVMVLGDAFASGFMDGSLYKSGQVYSFSKIIAQQAELNLLQATVESDNGWNPISLDNGTPGKFYLSYTSGNAPEPDIFSSAGELPNLEVENPIGILDLTIPGLRLPDINKSTLANSNIYFQRLQTSTSTTLVDEVILRDPTFLIIHIGTEDILHYIINGATGNFNAIDPEPRDATDPDHFRMLLENTINQLINNNRKGVLLNILNPLKAPITTKVPHALTEVITPLQASFANGYYTPFNNDVLEWNGYPDVPPEQRRPFMEFGSDAPMLWGIVIEDTDLSDAVLTNGTILPKIRQLQTGERVLLRVRNLLGKDNLGTTQLLADEFILTAKQAESISIRIEEYNSIIANIVSTNPNLALVDLDSFIDKFSTFEGVSAEGVPALPTYLQNGIFSSDGYFLNPRGHAFLANEVLNIINESFDGKIPLANPNDYRGNIIINDFD